MKNLVCLVAFLCVTAFPISSPAGALDKPGAATPAPGAPASSLAPGPKSMRIVGVVVEKLPTGVVIDAAVQRSREKPKGLTYIEGDFPKSFANDRVIVMATDAGTYDFTPAKGAKEVIRKMKVVK